MLVANIVRQATGLPECQHFDLIGKHDFLRCAWFQVRMNYGIRTNIKRRTAPGGLGRPSRFAEGEWVRIRSAEHIKATLDAQSRLRGLVFLPYQWPYCDRVFRIQKVMRQIVDDRGIYRPVSGTVLLEGVDCEGMTGREGCGRKCPLMFRDEWLEPASEPIQEAPTSATFVRVRSAEEILLGLDGRGKRDGLTFMPAMYQWAGHRLRVMKVVESVIECEQTVATRFPAYILERAQCSGLLAARAACDRACSLLWHPDWVTLDV